LSEVAPRQSALANVWVQGSAGNFPRWRQHAWREREELTDPPWRAAGARL